MRTSRRSSELKHSQIVLLGAGGVGKTSLLHRFLTGSYPSSYTPTIEDCYSYLIHMPDGTVESVSFIDTAGFHQFPAMRRLYIDGGTAFIVVFAVDDTGSVEAAASFADEIHAVKGDNVPLVFVGNKADDDEAELNTVVGRPSPSDHQHLVILTSALKERNIQQPFSELLQMMFTDASTVSLKGKQPINSTAASSPAEVNVYKMHKNSFCFKLTLPNCSRRRQSDEDSEASVSCDTEDVIVQIGHQTGDARVNKCIIC